MRKRIKQKLIKLFLTIISPFFNRGTKSSRSFHSFLFICSEGLGNAIMALPALAMLKKHLPDSKIYVWTDSPPIAQLFQKITFIDEVFFAKRSLPDFIKSIFALSKISIDWLGLSFPTFTLHYQLLALLLRSNCTVSHRYISPYFHKIESFFYHVLPINPHLHDVKQNAQLLATLGIQLEDDNDELYLDKSFIKNIAQKPFRISSVAKPTVLFHPGSKPGHAYKQWPLDHFIQTALKLQAENIARPLFLLGPDDFMFANKIHENSLEIVESCSIDETINILLSSDLLVCNDSGVMHLASLVETPILVIWGATNPKRNGPWTQKAKILTRNLSCQPCVHYDAFQSCQMGGPPYPCLDISPEEVVAEISAFLKQSNRTS